MRSRQKRVTHRDVAKLAGVSPAVVSYVVNGGPRTTSADARRRVLEAIETLSYHPSAAARGLRLQRTRTVGFISHDYYPLGAFYAPWNAGVLTGLTSALMAKRHYMLPYPVGVGEDLGGVDELLHSGRLDGVVVRLAQESPVTDPLLEIVAAAAVPCVCIERPGSARFGFSSVTYDDQASACAAVHYLLSQGHRRIAHIHGDYRQAAARDRLAGYRRALSEAEVGFDQALVEGGSWLPADAAAGMRRMLDAKVVPTAVFAANDQLAFSVIEVLREYGLAIPGDVAVLGFDDVPLAQELRPPLTTVHIPFADLGRRAAELLLQVMHADVDQCIEDVMPLELVRRGTA